MRIAILLSGRGSNLRALVEATRDGRIPAEVAVVVSNVAQAPGLAWARSQGLNAVALPHQDHPDRTAHDRAILAELLAARIDLVCLAGYLRLLGPALVGPFRHRIVNIHPSLLPAFPGLDAQAQALEHGVKLSGATVHLVDEELDHGPILLQEAVPVKAEDTVESLSERILAVEHRIYPQAVGVLARGQVRIEGRRARVVSVPA